MEAGQRKTTNSHQVKHEMPPLGEEKFHARFSFDNAAISIVLYFKGSEKSCRKETSLNWLKPALPKMF